MPKIKYQIFIIDIFYGGSNMKYKGLNKGIKIIIAVSTAAGLLLSTTACDKVGIGKGQENKPIENKVGDKLKEDLKEDDLMIESAENFVNDFKEDDIEGMYGAFGEELKKQLPKEKMNGLRGAIEQQHGEMKDILGTRIEKDENHNIVFVTVQFGEDKTMDFQLSFDKEKKIDGLYIVPTKVMPEGVNLKKEIQNDKFYEEEIKIGSGEWELPGTLTIPKEGKGPFKTVILVHGSGPCDRDETVMKNKPFRDIAHDLAEKGIAVLRYDKRTYVYPDKVAKLQEKFTPEDEYMDDVIGAIDFATSRGEIDNNEIFILGHSLGGYLVPRIYERSDVPAGYISMAGTIDGEFEDLMMYQYDYLASLDGEVSAEEKEFLNNFENEYNELKEYKASGRGDKKIYLGMPIEYLMYLDEYKPIDVAKKIKKPVLFLEGTRDYQVPAEHFNKWKEELKNNDNLEFKLYEGLNHLFIKGEGTPNPQEYGIPGHVDKQVIEDICDWINK